MARASRNIVTGLGPAGLFFFAIILAETAKDSAGFVGAVIGNIGGFCRDSATQWAVVSCLGCYLITILCAECLKLRFSSNPRLTSANFWLLSFVMLLLVRYLTTYSTATRSVAVCVFLVGLLSAKAVVNWVCGRDKGSALGRAWLAALLLVFLVCGMLWQPNSAMTFRYHNAVRWCGIWENPNIYGLLMGVGVLLSVGQIVWGWKAQCAVWQKGLYMALCSVAFLFCSIGLLKSYSRGAWLGTACGCVYQVAHWRIKSKKPAWLADLPFRWFAENGVPLTLVICSVVAVFLWNPPLTSWLPARRWYSVLDPNDFSWRNRLTACEAALQITADYPFIGAGWNRPGLLYQYYYLPASVDESAAIEMNDYLTLSATLGVPALFCFGSYLWLSLIADGTGQAEDSVKQFAMAKNGRRDGRLNITFQSSSIAFLVGFGLDGGLFKLAAASVFWILIELCRPSTASMAKASKVGEINRYGSCNRVAK